MMTSQLVNDTAAAIALEIRQKKYNRALLLLESINEKTAYDDQVIWQTALMAAKTGNLPLARSYAKELPEEFSPAVKQLRKAIENQMESFEIFISRYNEAVSMIKAGQLEAALQQLDQAMEDAEKLPLLPAVYQTKLLLMWKLNHPGLPKFALDLPVYAMDQKAVQAIFKLMEITDSPAQLPEMQPRKKPMKLWFLTAAAVVFLASATLLAWQNGGFLQSNLPKDHTGEQIPEVKPATANAPSEQEDAEDQNESSSSESEEAATIDQVSAFGTEAHSKAGENEIGTKPDEAASETDTLPTGQTPIPESVAKAYYKAGLDSYKAGDFPRAAAYLEMVLAAEEISYFTDDAAYYLTVSYLKESDYEKTIDLAAEFSRSESVHFTESPYKDAILLQKGNALYHAGKENEAIDLLTDLATDPSLGWVKGEADKTLKLVVEHEQHD